MIKKECKPCPKCGTPIHKIDGCDQMWDPQCGTAFSWRTGKITTGIIHNPHYFEYMREHGTLDRQPGDVPCGGDPTIRDVNNVFCWLPSLWKFNRIKNTLNNERIIENLEKRYYIINSIRILYHVRNIELMNNNQEWTQNINQKDRIKYIMSELSETEYKKNLFTNERQYEKNIEIHNIWETFANVLRDILNNYISENKRINLPNKPDDSEQYITVMSFFENIIESSWWDDHTNNGVPLCRIGNTRQYYHPSDVYIPSYENIKKIYDEIKGIEKYCNDQFELISKAYKLAVPLILIADDIIQYKKY